ncbi:MAG: hypothetical protein LBL26_02200 [Peptococcaceae bacterium]|jgi:hypothetical protein|nr:hypothetical protein [Peptococcaceae bacterium]
MKDSVKHSGRKAKIMKAKIMLVTGILLLGFASCGDLSGESGALAPGAGGNGTGGASSGRETYAASLIARSDNTLSSQEKEKVLKEISDELDYIMDVVQSLEIADDEALGRPEEGKGAEDKGEESKGG